MNSSNDLNNMVKTIICVAIAGALFITAVHYGYRVLFIIAAFFDWLPLPTGWMKIKGSSNSLVKRAGIIHGVVTIIAYLTGVSWIIIGRIGLIDLGYLFLLIWFQAVMLGSYTTVVKLSTIKKS